MTNASTTDISVDAPIVVSGTRPYAWPYDSRLDPADFAFVVVTGSSAGQSGQPPADLVESCKEFAAEVTTLGGSVIWTACNGSTLPGDLASTDMMSESPTSNGMIGGELELILRSQGIDRFALAGWPLEIAVHSTMRRANDIGYECILLEDLSVPLDPELMESSVSQILMSGGIFGAVGESSALLEALKTSTRKAGES